MSEAIFAIFAMYIFILLGFIAKQIFKEAVHSVTLNLLSIYFLQPFLTFWGLTKAPIDLTLIMAPLWYLLIIVIVLATAYPFVKIFFKDMQERSIATVAALIGNTGNLGIPLGIAIFGLSSVPYMTLINLVNVFIVYTIGVYFYSRGNFSVKSSLMHIIKLPILWFALLALLANGCKISFHTSLANTLVMGAYASIVVQLLLFGIYLSEAEFSRYGKRLISWVIGMKFIYIPLVTAGVLFFAPLDGSVKAMIFMELFMPLAVANINLSSLYGCKAKTVTVLVFVTSVLFLGLIFLYIPAMRAVFGFL